MKCIIHEKPNSRNEKQLLVFNQQLLLLISQKLTFLFPKNKLLTFKITSYHMNTQSYNLKNINL